MTAKVFISHSHTDRAAATELQGVLTKRGAETYLDQDKIQIADVLPDRIRQGIEWCNSFLLIWSSSAAASEWVGREWGTAYELRRKIIPYCLDSTSLPPALSNLVYVDRKDAEVAHAGLLRAVFGKDFTPSPTEVFPGRWRLTLNAFGLGTATHELELRANGQITGSGKIDRGGALDPLLASLEASDLLNLRGNISGTWGYDEQTEILTLDMVAHGFGQEFPEKIQVRTTGREVGEIQGRDFSGRTWAIRRLLSLELKQSLLQLERTLADFPDIPDQVTLQVTLAAMQQAVDNVLASFDAVAKRRTAVEQLGDTHLTEQFNKLCEFGFKFKPLWEKLKPLGDNGLLFMEATANIFLAEHVAKFRNECFGDA